MKTLKTIDRLKLTLYSVLRDEFKAVLIEKSNKDKSECIDLSERYSAFVVNRLFGDPNTQIYRGNEELFDALDYSYSGTAGLFLDWRYSELKSIVPDSILRYYQAHNDLGTAHLLAPKQEVFNKALQMGLISIDTSDYKLISDEVFDLTLEITNEKREYYALIWDLTYNDE